MADGSIDPRWHLMSLMILSKDVDVAKGLKSFAGYSGPIGVLKRMTKPNKTFPEGRLLEFVTVRICSRRMVADLEEWGVVPRKTWVGVVPNWLSGTELEEFYYRGLVDGDGYVMRDANSATVRRIGLTGNASVIRSFRDWCWRTSEATGFLRDAKTYQSVHFNVREGAKVYEALHRSPPRIGLLRKMLTSSPSPAS